MAIIGWNDNLTNNIDLSDGQVILLRYYAGAGTDVTYDADGTEEVFKVGIWQRAYVSGASAEVGVYDITDGDDDGTLVSGTVVNFTSTSGNFKWLEEELGTPVALTSGRTYAVAYLDTGSARFKTEAGQAYTANSTRASSDNDTTLPSTLAMTSSGSWHAAAYAETQASAGGGSTLKSLPLLGVGT